MMKVKVDTTTHSKLQKDRIASYESMVASLFNYYSSQLNNIQGWAANSTPGIYQWHWPVFTGLENTPQVANTGKYRQIEIFWA